MDNEPEMTRMWVNQPSTLQPLHHHNGMKVLAGPRIKGLKSRKVYPTEGDIFSMLVLDTCLSEGWPK